MRKSGSCRNNCYNDMELFRGKKFTVTRTSSESNGGNPLQALADQNLPSLGDHVVSGKQPEVGLDGSRMFSRKHQTGLTVSPASLSTLVQLKSPLYDLKFIA